MLQGPLDYRGAFAVGWSFGPMGPFCYNASRGSVSSLGGWIGSAARRPATSTYGVSE
jgi:hypothetical protein